MAPKKNIKMDLGSFLADDSFGGSSWADEEVDLNTIGISLNKPSSSAQPSNALNESSSFAAPASSFNDYPKKERVEYPIPDKPPYKAVVSNLPWDINEDVITRHFEGRMQMNDIISEVKLITDRESGRQKGFAFVTFNARDVLEESLNLNLTDLNGRKIFVSVAAPQKAEDGDWRSSRSGPLRERREPAADLDWGSARNQQASLPQRERSNRTNSNNTDRLVRRESRDNFDWGAARSTQAALPPRERSNRIPSSDRPPRKEEPDLDWGSARSQQADLPPRQRSNRPEGAERSQSSRNFKKEEPEFDWGAARSSQGTLPPRTSRINSQSNVKKESSDFDWKRGQPLKQQQQQPNKEEKKESTYQGPQKSSYSVLAGLEGDDEDEEEEQEKKQPRADVESLQQQTENLTISKEDTDGWEVVGK